MRFPTSFVCWIFLPMVLLGMVLCIYCFPLPLRLFLPEMEANKVGFKQPCPPLRMLSEPVQHFQSAILTVQNELKGRDFGELNSSIFLHHHKWLHVESGQEGGGFCPFSRKRDGDGHLFWECTLSPYHAWLGKSLNLHPFWPWTAVSGPGDGFGMVGCLA